MQKQDLRKSLVSSDVAKFVLTFTSLLTHFPTLKNISSIFFEKLRILEGREKSEERLRNEAAFPCGISTKKPDAQIGGTAPCEDSNEMVDEEDSETGLQCCEYLA